MKHPHTIVLLSAGLGSTVALWQECTSATLEQRSVTAVTLDYGQRHRSEINASRAIIDHYRGIAVKRPGYTPIEHIVVDMLGIGYILPGCALTGQGPVPNIMMIMTSIAAGIGIAKGADRLVIGLSAGHPDSRPALLNALESGIQHARPDDPMQLDTPFLRIAKDKIIQIGIDLDVPLNLTSSCANGGKHHCGRCEPCITRNDAFTTAGFHDPTTYRPQRTPSRT